MRLEYPQLLFLLPHRHPALLLDRVESVTGGAELQACKAVTGCEPCYQGLPDDLPPDRYAYPTSLLIESFGQAAAVLWLLSATGARRSTAGLPMFTAARDCVFEQPAYPGDVIRHRVRLEQVVDGAAFAAGESWVGGTRIAVFDSMMAVVRPAGAIAVTGSHRSERSQT